MPSPARPGAGGCNMTTPQKTATPVNLDAALCYAARGWHVFPCRESDGKPYTDRDGKERTPRAKQPYTPHGLDDATTDPAQIRQWWGRWPGAAIGLNCGRSGLLAIDLDTKHGHNGPATWAALGLSEAGALLSQTPSGGRHVVYTANGAQLGNTAGRLGDGIDTRGNGGYIILPPSTTTDGAYIALNDWGAAPAPLPGALAVLLAKPPERATATTTTPATATGAAPEGADLEARWARAALEGEADKVARAQAGTRNDTLNAAAFALGQLVGGGYLRESEVESALFEAARACGLVNDDGESATEKTIKSGLAGGKATPREKPHLTTPAAAIGAQSTRPTSTTQTATPAAKNPLDIRQAIAAPPPTRATGAAQDDNYLLQSAVDHEGHAQVVLKMFPNRMAHNDAFGWLWFTGSHWQRDGAEAHITRAIVQALKARAHAAIDAQYNTKEVLPKCSCDSGRIEGILKQLKALTVTPAEVFDTNPHTLNCRNGALDLENLTLTAHKPEDYFTYCLGADYIHEATESPEYKDLLGILETFSPDTAFLQLAGGYSLTGDTSEEVLFYLQGPARAGKGSFTEALLTLLPYPLATEAGFETFANDREGSSQNFDLAPLRPCRAVFASESERKHELNAARVKRLTGGNFITCAFKYQDQFTFRPQFKIWLSSNFPPHLDPDDDAAWGRVKVMHFPNSHLGAEDLSIKRKLKSAAYQAALLRWLADGAAMWHAAGLPKGKDNAEGQRIAEQTQAERDAQDFVLQFLEERITQTGKETDKLTTGDLYGAYESWCKGNGVSPKYINEFTKSLKQKGYVYTRAGNARSFEGVSFK